MLFSRAALMEHQPSSDRERESIRAEQAGVTKCKIKPPKSARWLARELDNNSPVHSFSLQNLFSSNDNSHSLSTFVIFYTNICQLIQVWHEQIRQTQRVTTYSLKYLFKSQHAIKYIFVHKIYQIDGSAILISDIFSCNLSTSCHSDVFEFNCVLQRPTLYVLYLEGLRAVLQCLHDILHLWNPCVVINVVCIPENMLVPT